MGRLVELDAPQEPIEYEEFYKKIQVDPVNTPIPEEMLDKTAVESVLANVSRISTIVGTESIFGTNFRVFYWREASCRYYSFAIPSLEAINIIAKYGPILEINAGTGYWAYELRKRGVDIVATDPRPVSGKRENDYHFKKEWTEVLELNALKAMKAYPNRTLLTVWPSYAQSWTSKALKAFKGDTLIYVGEGNGGCTGDEEFHKELNTNWDEVEFISIPQWYGIRDHLFVYKRKAVK